MKKKKSFFWNSIEKSREIDSIDGKIAMFSIGNSIKLSILLPHSYCSKKRWNEDRYPSRRSEITSSSEHFLNMKLEMSFSFIAASKGWGGCMRSCCMAPDSREPCFRQAQCSALILRNSVELLIVRETFFTVCENIILLCR